jgi:RNA polymerase sigma-70 factor (ECF subfamily)
MSVGAPDLAVRLDGIVRQDRGRLLSALIAGLRDFDLAEEALAEAVEAALRHWHRTGLPRRPDAWLLRVARRKAIDRIRRSARWRDRSAELARLAQADQDDAEEPPPPIPDERLRLILTCCHPALDPKSRVALTLRTLGGLSTAEVARAFLDAEPTMAQRLGRAKAKIRDAGIRFTIPEPGEWEPRFASVLSVVYLIFNEGYSASSGEGQVRADLCEEAIYLARLLTELRPDEAEGWGLLSLLLTTHARAKARMDAEGTMVPLAAQDRGLWDRTLIEDGLAALDRALTLLRPGPFQIKAAIGALHVQAKDHASTDWRQMLLLYSALLAHEPTEVVRLNRAVVLAETGALAEALAETERLGSVLATYQPYHATRADLLRRTGDAGGARQAYERAIALSRTEDQRRFLAGRLAELTSAPARGLRARWTHTAAE